MFINGFYLSPFLEKKHTFNEFCRIKNKVEESDFHKITIGEVNLFYCKPHFGGLASDLSPDCQQSCVFPSLSLLVPLDSSTVAQLSGFHLYSNNEYLYQRWKRNTHVLLLTIPLSACTELLPKMGLSSSLEGLSLVPEVMLPTHVKPLIVNVINGLLYCYERRHLKLPFQNIWDQEAECLAATFLLQHLHHSFDEHADKYQGYLNGGNKKNTMIGLERLEEYLGLFGNSRGHPQHVVFLADFKKTVLSCKSI